MRCQHHANDDLCTHCTAPATHYILHQDGEGVPGAWCEEHASEIVAEYRAELNWNWSMEPMPEEEL